jgi:hypothetical protein
MGRWYVHRRAKKTGRPSSKRGRDPVQCSRRESPRVTGQLGQARHAAGSAIASPVVFNDLPSRLLGGGRRGGHRRRGGSLGRRSGSSSAAGATAASRSGMAATASRSGMAAAAASSAARTHAGEQAAAAPLGMAAAAIAAASTTAIATASSVAIAAVAATTAVTSLGLVVGAHEGDADDREEDRDAKEHCTIHTRVLPLNRYRTERDPFHDAVILCFHPPS